MVREEDIVCAIEMNTEDKDTSTFGRKEVQGFWNKNKLPRDAGFQRYDVRAVRSRNPFALSSWGSSSPANTTKP